MLWLHWTVGIHPVGHSVDSHSAPAPSPVLSGCTRSAMGTVLMEVKSQEEDQVCEQGGEGLGSPRL